MTQEFAKGAYLSGSEPVRLAEPLAKTSWITATHEVRWTIGRDEVHGEVTCDGDDTAFCRVSCADGSCEQWPREGCAHGLTPTGYCNVVEFIVNGDSIESAYIGEGSPLRSGPIEVEWQGDWYGWRYPDKALAEETQR